MDPHNIRHQEQERAADALREFYLRSHRLFDRMMTARGASFARTKLLSHIVREGPARSIDLASSFGFAPRTITEAIDGLERDGLVRRDPDPNDRRAKRITLTSEGEVVVRASEATRQDYIREVFAALEDGELAELIRIVGKLADRLEHLADVEPQP